MRTDTPKLRRRFNAGRWLAVGMGSAALLSMLGPAQATFHLMKIAELFPGTALSPNAQYVVLQMYSGGQNLLSGHNIIFYDAAGNAIHRMVLSRNVANGANQAKILIATPEAATFFNVQPDFTMPARLMRAGGKVCFADGIDCVSWGKYTGGTLGVGTPFNGAGGGLLAGKAVARRLDIYEGVPGGGGYGGGGTTGDDTMLEGGDDTNNSANDFRFATPAPRNNANVVGRAPASTCGNARVEGLEQCDDGNTVGGDSCTATCSQITAAPYRAPMDINADIKSDVAWRNGQTGQNAVWFSANPATRMTVTAVTNVAWRIVGVGDFNGDGRADLLWRETRTGANTIWRSASSTSLQPVTALDTTWSVAGIGDFDGDGKSDIVWRNLSGQNAIWRSGSSATRTAVTAVTNTQWRIAGVGDFDGDRRADLLWRNASAGSNVIWRSASSSFLTSVTSLDATWLVGGIGDFDGDGKSDILWRNLSGQNAIWRSGNSATRTSVTGITNSAWRIAAVADYNGDRRADLLWRNVSTGANVIWRSASSSFLTSVPTLDTSWSAAR